MAIDQRTAGNSIMYLGKPPKKDSEQAKKNPEQPEKVTTILFGSIAYNMFKYKDVVELRNNMKSLLDFRGGDAYPVASYGGKDDRDVCTWRITVVDEKYPTLTQIFMQVEQLLRPVDVNPVPTRLFARVGIEDGAFKVKYGFGAEEEHAKFIVTAKTAEDLGNAIKGLISEFAKEIGLMIIKAD